MPLNLWYLNFADCLVAVFGTAVMRSCLSRDSKGDKLEMMNVYRIEVTIQLQMNVVWIPICVRLLKPPIIVTHDPNL